MILNNPLMKYLGLLLLFFCIGAAYAQAPVIAYPTPKTYIINTPVAPLIPLNSGGAVPADIFGNVIRFAGQTGIPGAAGGVPSQSQFILPYSICSDPTGNVFVNDPANKAIKQISPAGNVDFRSQGVPVDVGSGLALNNFENPTGIVADAAGNVYIADTDNNLIRKVTPDKTISIFAGNRLPASIDGTGAAAGFSAPTQMTIDDNGNLYVIDGGDNNNKIRKITPAG